MGGDRAPAETVAGAALAAADGIPVVLVGDRERLDGELSRLDTPLSVVHAPAVIEMGDDPARAIREKPDSSIVTCARLLRDGEVSAMVSAGSTGAVMASAAIVVGRIAGVLRPTIATVFPTPGTPTLVLDSGANPEVKPEHLVQFAVMGAVAARLILGIEKPRVGLLNIGEEPSKGRDLERSAHRLLSEAPIRFVGNVEGRDLGADRADVFVTDGFTGNVVLKTTEGTAQMVAGMLLEALAGLDADVVEAVLPVLADVRRRGDYEHTGGAHLLGVNGVVIIAHGSSGRVAVANAIRMAHAAAAGDLPVRLAEQIAVA
jgi:phosphate acyltransferase